MKKKQFESLCKKLLPSLPGFTCNGWLLHVIPVGKILRGFCCEDSGLDPHKFAVTVFFLPLYVPSKHLHFNMGFRLKDTQGCDIWWNLQDEDLVNQLMICIQQQGLPFLNRVENPQEVTAVVPTLHGPLDPYRLEAMAYSLAMTDDHAAAQSALRGLVKVLDKKVQWQAEMLDRAENLERKLNTDLGQAKDMLAEWEQSTVKNLGL